MMAIKLLGGQIVFRVVSVYVAELRLENSGIVVMKTILQQCIRLSLKVMPPRGLLMR